jgi:hypothetical protein
MPALPENGFIQLVRITDDLGDPARVSQIGGVWRLAVDAVLGGGGGAAQTGAFDSGVADETQIGLYVRSGATGLHGGLAVNARNVPIEARSPGTAYLDERLYGLYALAHVRGIDGDQAVGSQSVPIGARLPSNISGELSTAFDVLGTMAVITGIDLSAGSLLRTVEARTLATWDASPETSPVLGTAAILHGRDVGAADYSRIMADLVANVSGRSAAGVAVRGIYANAINVGIDSTGAAVLRPSEARTPGTSPLDERLYGLYTLAHMRALNAASAAGSQSVALQAISSSAATSDERLMHLEVLATLAMIDTGAPAGSQQIPLAANRNVGAAATETGYYLATRSSVMGFSLAAAVGSRSVPIEAYPASQGTLTADQYGLAALTKLFGANCQTGNTDSISCDTASNINTRGPGSAVALYAAAIAIGIDSGANLIRPIEVIGANTTTTNDAFFSLATVQGRESAYAAARRGKRFYATNSSVYSYGTLLTAQTAFVTTTPTLLLLTDTTTQAIIRSLSLAIGNTPGGSVYIAIHLDTANRYVSGGVSVIPRNTNEASATAAVVKVYENPTTSIVGATARPLASAIAPATAGTMVNFDFKDGILLGANDASLLIYIWAASTAPQILWTTEHEEVT